MNGVIRTILGSGDGFTQKTPRHVLMFDHALDVLAAEGLSFGKARIVSRTVEFVPLVVPYVVEGKKQSSISISARSAGTNPRLHLPARPHVAVQQPQTPHL